MGQERLSNLAILSIKNEFAGELILKMSSMIFFFDGKGAHILKLVSASNKLVMTLIEILSCKTVE